MSVYIAVSILPDFLLFYYRTYSYIQIFIVSKIKEISRYHLNRQCLNISIRESDSTIHHTRQIKPSSDLWSIPSTRADFIRRDAIIHAAGTRSPNSPNSLISRIIFSPAHFVWDAIRGRRDSSNGKKKRKEKKRHEERSGMHTRVSNGYAKTEGAFMELTTRVSSRVSRAPSPCRERLTRLTRERIAAARNLGNWTRNFFASEPGNQQPFVGKSPFPWELSSFPGFSLCTQSTCFCPDACFFLFFSVCVIEDGISHCSADRE